MSLENLTEKNLIFAKFYTKGVLKNIYLSEIPEEVREHFKYKIRLYSWAKEYSDKDFNQLAVILHHDDSKTYLSRQTVTYTTNKETEELTYLMDVNKNEEAVGVGEIRLNLSNRSDYFKDKPFVGYTETFFEYREKGLGTRRLFVMNALTQMFYELPLHSDTSIVNEAERLWEKLVKEKEARMFKEGEWDRFVFL